MSLILHTQHGRDSLFLLLVLSSNPRSYIGLDLLAIFRIHVSLCNRRNTSWLLVKSKFDVHEKIGSDAGGSLGSMRVVEGMRL